MQDHLHFGAPPKLRPRTAGASRSSLPPNEIDYGTGATSTSTSASAPERLASAVNALKQSPSLLLRQRLQSPRPESAAPQQAIRAPGAAASSDEKGVFMKPPMRPKSANAASRQVSRHRMQLVQDPVTGVNSNQSEDVELMLQRGPETVLTAGKENVVRPGVASTAARAQVGSSMGYGKRPFSAAAALSSYRASASNTSNQPAEALSVAVGRAASGIKRPHSAAASSRNQPLHAREKSSGSLASCLSVVSHTSKTPRSMSASSSRSGQSRGDRLLASTREHIDNTFVYAVPRHFLEHGLPYDPYDIVPVTHEALFGGGSVNQLQDAHWDYYTISRAGYTFHVKNDSFQSTFLSLSDWEAQKAQFTKLRSISTFSRFRYRKVFMFWKQWVRGNKRETARENLISDCYFSYPILLNGMHEVRQELSYLSKVQLMWDFDGATASLEHFTSANTQFLKLREKELRQIVTRIQKILAGVCRVFLDDTAPLHVGFPGHEFALSVRKSSNYHILESYVQCEHGLASAHQQFLHHKHFQSTRLTPETVEGRTNFLVQPHRDERYTQCRTGQTDELEDIRWTMASIKRRKCKQLTKFVTLVDFLLLDTYARVVKQSLDLFHGFVLRGANAATIRHLTDHDDLVIAMHQTLRVARKHSIQSAGEGSMDPSDQTRQSHYPLTRQQIKAFLHAAWEGKLNAATSSSSVLADAATEEANTVSTNSTLSVASMENKLEALFFYGLSKYTGANAETCSMDDLFFVAENSLIQLLVLPPFAAAATSIYSPSETQITNEPNSSGVQVGNMHLPSLAEQEVLAIPCFGPQPLFALDVATGTISEKRGRQRHTICFKPELALLVRVFQGIIIGFTEVFREVPPLLSSPELRSVLEFANDIRALRLHTEFNSRAGLRSSTAPASRMGVSFPADVDEQENQKDNDNGGANDDEERFRSPADRILERTEEDMHYLSVRDCIQDLVRSALHGAEELAASYAKVLELRQQNESINFDLKARLFRRNEYNLDEMMDDATHFMDQLRALETLRMSVNVEFLHFNMHQLQTELLPSPARCLDVMRELLPRLAREKCDQFLHYINISSSKIEKPMVQDLDAFTKYLLNLREVYDEVLDKELDLTFIHDFFGVLDTLRFSATADTIKTFELCEPEFQALKSHVQEAYANRDTDLQNYAPLQSESLAKLSRRMSWLQSTASDQAMAAKTSSCQDARDNAVKLYDEAKQMQEEARRLIRIQQVFEEASSGLRPPSKTFEDLNELSGELKLKSELWEAVCEADEHLSVCSTDTIRLVDLDKMGTIGSHVDSVVENIRQCATRVAGGFELERLEKLQATLHGLAPVIRDLRNPHLAERHWSKLEHRMQCSLMPISIESKENSGVDEVSTAFDDVITTSSLSARLDLQVQQLLEVNAVAHGTAIRHVSEEASAEAAIAGSFMSVVRTWEAQEIPVEPRKDRDGRDVYCIGDCVELASLIEESQVLLRVMDLSTYSLVVQERLPKMLSDLNHTKESLELLQVCQRKWDYTQRLVSIDFARTFPEQAKQLQKHDSTWRSLTLNLYNRSLCLPFGVSPEQRQSLHVILEGFEAAAKALADHLEIKRQVFPAFFKLSDLELATLLSRCRDVGCIPSFLYQCFDNVGRIVFGVRDGFQDILQVTSRVHGEAETIPMGKNLKARGPVEQWLAAVEKRLAEQLRRSTKQAIEMLSHYERSDLGVATPKLDISHFPIQSILLADRVVRCWIIENGLQDIMSASGTNRFEKISSDLAAHSTRVMNQLFPSRQFASLQQEVPILSPREIALRTSLRLQEIHFRDALASHVSSKSTSSSSTWTHGGLAVDWEYQLKYRMDDATTVGHECHVEMNTLNIPYGFTYMNPNIDVVVTPSSLRTLFSLFACIRHAQGCVLTGPSESGKQTLTTQVSSILGRRNFSATLASHSQATRMLVGALYAGGTFCASLQLADKVESNASLIKSLVTTLEMIEHSVLTKNPIVGLHHSPITFVPSTAMFIVFPSSLNLSMADAEDIRIWTEPLSRFAIVHWDRKYIVEALLLSRNFSDPGTLSKKLEIMWHQARSTYALAQGEKLSSHESPFSFSALKCIIADAAAQLDAAAGHTSNKTVLQEVFIHKSVMKYFSVRINADLLKGIEGLIENVFPSPTLEDEDYSVYHEITSVQLSKTAATPELPESIALAIREMKFIPRRAMLDSISSLATAVTSSVSTILVGPSGVGKTTSYQVLAKAFELYLQRQNEGGTSTSLDGDVQNVNKTHTPGPTAPQTPPAAISKRSNSFLTSKVDKGSQPSVAVHVVLPMALTTSQLYGGVSLDGRGRVPSMLGQLIREAQERYNPNPTSYMTGEENASNANNSKPTESLRSLHNQVWVVFDDALDLRWLEGLLAVLSNPSGMSTLLAFEDGEFMTLPPNLRFIFEILQLRDATPSFLHVSAILHLSADSREGAVQEIKPSCRRAKPIDTQSRMAISTAYLHRYLVLQRDRITQQQNEVVKSEGWSPLESFNVLEKWLLNSSMLVELTTVLDTSSSGMVYLSSLQRTTNLTSLLQSLISTASALPDPTTRTSNEDNSSADGVTQFAQDTSNGQIRVEMALIFSLLWGFAACTGGHPVIQRQVSDVIRREFEHLTPAWIDCGVDVNLFETLLDLQELRFVSIVSTAGQVALPPPVVNTSSISTLFVPTSSSLVVHAAIREALRSGRGVLLLGDDSARRTTLARNFLGQIEVIRSIIAAGGISKLLKVHQANADDSDKSRKPVLSKAMEAATLASVKRLRLRQISLVTWMAMRLQKDTGDDNSLQSSRNASIASISATSDNRSMASVVEAEEGIPLVITPSTDLTKTAMVRQFDRGDVIPFFFAMPHGTTGSYNGDAATELANCLERMLQRERTGVFEPPPGKTALLILDDLHLAIPEHSDSTKRPLFPSVYAYLRSVQEHRVVFRGASCLPISVENLMLFASMHTNSFHTTSSENAVDKPLQKLTAHFFPVLAPSCGLEELHHIFGQALQSHWIVGNSSKTGTLPTAVRYAIPLVIAATTVLWDRLRGTYKYHLQDLARVYEGLAGVSPSLLADVETLVRLWVHECSRTLQEPSMGLRSPRQDGDVAGEISRMRRVVSQVTQRRASARASRLSLGPGAGLSFVVVSRRQSVQANQHANDESASPATLLSLFAARSSASTPSGGKVISRPSQQYSPLQEQHHRAAMVGGLWAFVPASVYYGGAPISLDPVREGDSVAASSDAGPSGRAYRRSSASFMRQRSLESAISSLTDADTLHGASDKNGRWMYAEISFEDDTETVSTANLQQYYRDLRTFSSARMTLKPWHSKNATALPGDVPPVPFKLARTVVRIDRVLARPAARLVLMDSNGSGADTLLRFATVLKMPETHLPGQTDSVIFTISGLVDDPNITTSVSSYLKTRWKRLLLELYERVGVAGQEATLVVKRLDLLPVAIINQLHALMTTGEVPGALSLEEQVHLATRVCDERLLALKAKHAAQVAHIRSEAEATRDQALAVLQQKQRDAPTTQLLEAFQQVEVQYQREMRSKLARVDLRWQQDTDDLRRQREVESESVAATVMALTRPLGVTSGKWASAVARMCSKLRVVLLINKEHETYVRAASPNAIAICDVVSIPQLDRDSLRVLLYGHFNTEVQQLVVEHKSKPTTTDRKPEDGGLADFLHQMQRGLWNVVCMATDMHLAVIKELSSDKARGCDTSECPPITRAFAVAAFFAKLVVEGYRREEVARAKASWFLDLSNRLDRDLGVLRSSDVILSEQLTTIHRQLVDHEAKLIEQKQDAERIRLIMQRFQTAADEQIQVTNEAQEIAQQELREPMACLEEANRALLLVDRRHIVEIKSFVSPPPLVHLVLGAVCVLFQLEPSWESARRLLLGDANVVQTLLQFNKDAVPAATLAKLEAEYLSDQRFCREEVERQSVAAASMVGWVRAIHQYSSARKQVQPTLDKLEKAQSRLQLIMQEFQVSKQRVVEADEAWQATQAAIDSAITRKEALTGEISWLDARCDSGGLALDALKEDRKLQHEAASASSMRRGFLLTTWNALFSAGSLAYACELSFSPRRHQIFKAWEAAYCGYGGLTPGCPPTSTCCTFMPSIAVVLKGITATVEQVPTNLREHDTPVSVLFSGDYPEDGAMEVQDALKLVTGAGGLGFSRRRLWDASLLSLVAATPAMHVVMITRFTPEVEELFVNCARRVWRWHQLQMVYARAHDFDEVFRLAASMGYQLLVLDVEPLDSELRRDEQHGVCLHAALLWRTKRIDGVEHLVLSQISSDASLNEDEYTVNSNSSTTTGTIALHPNFRLILTSNASRSAFGELLDMLPTLDAQLHTDDMADVMLDKIWSSSVLNSVETAIVSESTQAFTLKKALKEHGRLAEEYEASHTQLTKLLEAAAVTSQFPLAQTKVLRQKLSAIQEARQGLRDKRREIQEQLRLVKRQCAAIARTGAAVFNAFNVTVGKAGSKRTPPLTLQVFISLLLDTLIPTSTTTAPVPTAPTTPLLRDAKRPSSSHRASLLLARGATSSPLSASSRRRLNSVGIPSELLTTLLIRIAPLVPPTSSNGDWYRFLLQVIIFLEDIQPLAQNSIPRSVEVSENPDAGDFKSPRSASTILLQAKLKKQGRCSSSITAEICQAAATSSTRTELQRQIVSTIFNGCKSDHTLLDASDVNSIMRSALPGTSSRSERLCISLLLFPGSVQHVCDRVLAGYGVPLNFHRCGSGIANTTPADVDEATAMEGFWLRTIQALPEKTAAIVFTRHEFHSFSFARRVFFYGLKGSTWLQVRVLQMLGERKFRAVRDDDNIAAMLGNADAGELVPLTRLYVLPPSVPPPEDDEQTEAQQLLITAESFKQVVQMEKTHLEVLEEVPLAIVNMNNSGLIPEYWEGLFQILHRSSRRTTSAAFQRHNSMDLSAVVGGEILIKRPSIVASENASNDSSLGRTTMTSSLGLANAHVIASTSSTPPLVRSGTARRSSTSQSMVRRLSAIDRMTPTYPRLVAAVDDISTLPVHLRQNIVCFRDEYEEEPGISSGSQAPASISKCLQSTILRLAMHPCVQTLCTLVQPTEDDTPRVPLTYFWQVLSGLVLFHATLVFRANVLRAVYPGVLPPKHHPDGAGAVFHYNDDDFITAINQYLTTVVEKKQHYHHSPQHRRTGKGSEYSVVLERRIYQQVVLSSYTRLAAGNQEVEFLRRHFSECLQLVFWNESSTVESGGTLGSLQSVRGRSRQMTVRDQLRGAGTSGDITLSAQSSSMSLVKGPSSLSHVKCSLCLGFLAFPSEGLRQADLSMRQWLELLWGYSTTIDPQIDSKLQSLLLGHQLTSNNPRGSLEDTSRDLMMTSSGIEIAKHPPPKWMWSFGWSNTLFATSAEMVATIPLRDAIDVLHEIITEALPPRFDQESKNQAERISGTDCGDSADVEPEQLACGRLKNQETDLATKATVITYNLQVSACTLALEGILTSLHAVEDPSDTPSMTTSLAEQPESGEEDDDADESTDEHQKQNEEEEGHSLTLLDIEDACIRQQVAAILCNEVPLGIFGRASSSTKLVPPISPTWSLHDVLQHYQDWHQFLTASQSVDPTGPPRWWLPGLIGTGLPVTHILESALMNYSSASTSSKLSLQFTLRPPDTAEEQEDSTDSTSSLPRNTIAILEGVVLLGATWNNESQCLERVDELKLRQRVELLCSVAASEAVTLAPAPSSIVPLLGSHDGSLLLECPLPARLPALASPFLVPLGSFYR